MRSNSTTKALGARFLQAFECELATCAQRAVDVMAREKIEAVDFRAMPYREVTAALTGASFAAGVFPPTVEGELPAGAVRIEGPAASAVQGAVHALLDAALVVEFRDQVESGESRVIAGQARVRSAIEVPKDRRFYILDSLLDASFAARLVLLGCAIERYQASKAGEERRAAKIAAELDAICAMLAAGVRPFGQDGPALLEGGAS